MCTDTARLRQLLIDDSIPVDSPTVQSEHAVYYTPEERLRSAAAAAVSPIGSGSGVAGTRSMSSGASRAKDDDNDLSGIEALKRSMKQRHVTVGQLFRCVVSGLGLGLGWGTDRRACVTASPLFQDDGRRWLEQYYRP